MYPNLCEGVHIVTWMRRLQTLRQGSAIDSQLLKRPETYERIWMNLLDEIMIDVPGWSRKRMHAEIGHVTCQNMQG